MLIRISLILAIIAGLAVGVLNFTQVKEKITKLQSDLKEQTELKVKAQTELAATKKDLEKTTAELKQTKTTLEATTKERDTAVQVASEATKRAEKLTEDLNKTRTERDDAQREVAAFRASGLNPEQALNAAKQIKGLQDALAGSQEENTLLGKRIKKLDADLAFYRDPTKTIELPATIKGKVLVCDPKWHFVVINAGEDQGVVEHGELLVNRDGKLVAKVIVSSVQKDRCVANVMTGWQLGEIYEGDVVTPAHPKS
jgi:flagellar biosynthesis chaperone FliJ